MAALAAVCGVLLILFGALTTRRAPTEAQIATEMICFVGGLLLFFIAVVLARLRAIERRIGTKD